MAAIRKDLDEWIQTCPQTPKAGNKITWMYDPESAYLDARDFYGVYVFRRAICGANTNDFQAISQGAPIPLYNLPPDSGND